MIIRTAIFLILSNTTLLSGQMLLSHNDYEQDIPLHDALNRDFEIIEADIYLRSDSIVVCHDEDKISNAPTLEDLYLRPLQAYPLEQLKGKILMLDIKEFSPLLLTTINNLKTKYKDLFDQISILISGDFDRNKISDNPIYDTLLLDGRMKNVASNISTQQMPIISIKITDICGWEGCSRITLDQAQKLKSVIDQIHESGRKIRFWNVEDGYQAWNVLRALEVDIIGVDNLEKYSQYQLDFPND